MKKRHQQKLVVATTADGGGERAIAYFKNNSTSSSSLCNLYITSGDIGSTYLSFVSSNYIHWGGKYKTHTLLGNNGKGLVFRTGQDDEGRIAFEFKRELGTTYTYDEKVSITYEGNMGIGIIQPQRKLHINDVMRLEPRHSVPENPSEGDIYMDAVEHVLKVYDGTSWITSTSLGTARYNVAGAGTQTAGLCISGRAAGTGCPRRRETRA